MSKKKKIAAASPLPVPPLVAAIARFTDPGIDGLHPEFVNAWQMTPNIVRAFVEGHDGSIKHINRVSVIEEMVRDRIEESRRGATAFDRGLADAIDLLQTTNEDFIGDIQAAHEQPAFQVGLALGIYLALNGGAR
jgi:hypothetical protein